MRGRRSLREGDRGTGARDSIEQAERKRAHAQQLRGPVTSSEASPGIGRLFHAVARLAPFRLEIRIVKCSSSPIEARLLRTGVASCSARKFHECDRPGRTSRTVTNGAARRSVLQGRVFEEHFGAYVLLAHRDTSGLFADPLPRRLSHYSLAASLVPLQHNDAVTLVDTIQEREKLTFRASCQMLSLVSGAGASCAP